MLGRLGKEYVSVNIPGESAEGYRWSRKTLWRRWNQLSRFQRSLIYMLIAALILAIIYFLPGFTKSTLRLTDLRKKEENVAAFNSQPPATKPLESEKSIRAKVEKPQEFPVGAEEKRNGDEVHQQHAAEETNDVEQIRSPPQQGIKFSGPANERQSAVIATFRHAWKGYKKFAWGHDHLKPITASFQDWFSLGLTIVDSLDTIYIMGLKEEYTEAREWVANNLHFDVNRDVNLFEVTIRVLGGLLSAYHLSGDKMYLDKAVDLGNRLLPCFSSASGVPFSDVNLSTREAHAPKWSPDSSTSEVTTLQLEFRDLSRSTGDPRYEEAAAKVSLHVHKLPKTDGLVPIFINANSGNFRSYATITMGARGDSYYEYLLKQWIQTGKTLDFLRDDYLEAIAGARKHLVRRTPHNKYLFVGELLAGGRDFKPKMDHLTCYLPGTLALGVHFGLPEDHMRLAEDLLYTCYQLYAQQPTFLAAEITYFNLQDATSSDMYVKTNDAHSLLRPEFIESLWYMYQLTGNKTYQDWGWQIFQAMEKYARVTNGYTSLGNVRNPQNTKPKDMMESFFLGETLKYLYLLFGNDRQALSLDTYVINSEAHPLPIYNS